MVWYSMICYSIYRSMCMCMCVCACVPTVHTFGTFDDAWATPISFVPSFSRSLPLVHRRAFSLADQLRYTFTHTHTVFIVVSSLFASTPLPFSLDFQSHRILCYVMLTHKYIRYTCCKLFQQFCTNAAAAAAGYGGSAAADIFSVIHWKHPLSHTIKPPSQLSISCYYLYFMAHLIWNSKLFFISVFCYIFLSTQE